MGNGAMREMVRDMINRDRDIENEATLNQNEIQRLNEEAAERDDKLMELRENMAGRAAQEPVVDRGVDLDLRSRIEVLERDKEKSNKDMDDLKAEVQRLNEEVERRTKANKQQEEQINNLNDEIKQLTKRLEDRESEKNKTRTQPIRSLETLVDITSEAFYSRLNLESF